MNASISQNDLPEPLAALVAGFLTIPTAGKGTFSAALLAGDGSDRRYFRIRSAFHSQPLIAVDAHGGSQKFRRLGQHLVTENHSFLLVAQHLATLQFPIPKVLASSPCACYYLLEDLGDTTLYDLAANDQWSTATIAHYQQALCLLAALQQQAAEGFDPSWCYAGGHYDRQLIIAGELEYFLNSFAIPLGRIELSAAQRRQFRKDCALLADVALQAPGHFFLHRDFQAKNLMICTKHIRVIDFQGARLGPIYYDLAALLTDPYVAMPPALQQELLEYYYHTAAPRAQLSLPEPGVFNHNVSCYSLIRGMQVLGAFGFLSTVKKRLHFRQHIPQALLQLQRLAADAPLAPQIPTLARLIRRLSHIPTCPPDESN
ncbi:MAG: phosphotransferase [Deltaproteobacteria bacterium]|nr:phosphotransferase [Candidatus Anaeroferrophillus wilburensis]MBN2889550.1 phosphotransferase [Deltaproteobacteria bacterium]